MSAFSLYDRGTAILIEVEHWTKVPHNPRLLSDPDVLTITVADPVDVIKVNGITMVREATGKWSYIIQTETTWTIGNYKVTINSTVGSVAGVKVREELFKLI